MSRQDLVVRSQRALGWLTSQVKIANSAGFTDINLVSESLCQNLLNLLEDGANYANVNIDSPNTSSIDLGDVGRKIAVQITSTSTAKKIKKTITAFEARALHKQYKTLRILFLADKYTPRPQKVKGAKIVFEDVGALHNRITKLKDTTTLKNIVELLESELQPPGAAPTRRRVELVKDRAEVTTEALRLRVWIRNIGPLSVEHLRMSVSSSSPGYVNVIPKAHWSGTGTGEDSARTFMTSEHVHPGSSVLAVVELHPQHVGSNTQPIPASLSPVKFRFKLLLPDSPPLFSEIKVSRKELTKAA